MATFLAKSFSDPAWTASSAGDSVERLSKAEDFTLTSGTDEVHFFKLPPESKILAAGVAGEDLDTAAAARAKLSITNGTVTVDLATGIDISAAFTTMVDPVATALIDGNNIKQVDDTYYLALIVTTNATGWQAGNIQAYVRYTTRSENGEF